MSLAGRHLASVWFHPAIATGEFVISHAVGNHVIDSSSIEVNRRARRAKTDRLDLGGLLSLFAGHQQGDRRWRGVRAPVHQGDPSARLDAHIAPCRVNARAMMPPPPTDRGFQRLVRLASPL